MAFTDAANAVIIGSNLTYTSYWNALIDHTTLTKLYFPLFQLKFKMPWWVKLKVRITNINKFRLVSRHRL